MNFPWVRSASDVGRERTENLPLRLEVAELRRRIPDPSALGESVEGRFVGDSGRSWEVREGAGANASSASPASADCTHRGQ